MASDTTRDIWEILRSGSAAELADDLRAKPESARTPSSAGELPLTVAARGGSEEKLRALLAAGALLNAATSDALGETCLHAALRSPAASVSLCRWLVSIGAELNAGDAAGRTPLHVAVERGEPAFVEMLVEEGADPAMRDGSARSALDDARAAGRRDLVEIMMAALK